MSSKTSVPTHVRNQKMELVYHDVYHTRDEAQTRLFEYIEAFYNRRRRHSALHYLGPEAFERLGDQEAV